MTPGEQVTGDTQIMDVCGFHFVFDFSCTSSPPVLFLFPPPPPLVQA